MRIIPLLLPSGADLQHALQDVVREYDISAGWIMTGVGSLRRLRLRVGGIHTAEDDFEIISAAGTLSRGGLHVHLAVADPQGTMLGGHLMEGCIVADEGTVEIVIGVDESWRFRRGRDARSGFDELVIERA